MRSFAPARFLRRLFTNRSGMAAVETAFLIPAFFTLILGGMNFGVAFYKGLTVQWSVERAARRAMIDATLTEAQLQAAINATLDDIDSNLVIDISLTEDLSGVIPVARVSGAFNHPVEVPFMPVIDTTFKIDIRVPRPAPAT